MQEPLPGEKIDPSLFTEDLEFGPLIMHETLLRQSNQLYLDACDNFMYGRQAPKDVERIVTSMQLHVNAYKAFASVLAAGSSLEEYGHILVTVQSQQEDRRANWLNVTLGEQFFPLPDIKFEGPGPEDVLTGQAEITQKNDLFTLLAHLFEDDIIHTTNQFLKRSGELKIAGVKSKKYLLGYVALAGGIAWGAALGRWHRRGKIM